jgi:hypothetical protein
MGQLLPYVYGDGSVWRNGSVVQTLGDSVFVQMETSLPFHVQTRGFGDRFADCQLTNRGTNVLIDSDYLQFETAYNQFSWTQRRRNGASTTSGSITAGATTCTINAPATGQGSPYKLMYVTVDAGGANPETLVMSSSYTEGSTTFSFRTAFAHNHSSGVSISWTRPSAVDSYYNGPTSEMLLTAGTYGSPTEAAHGILYAWWTGTGNAQGRPWSNTSHQSQRYIENSPNPLGTGPVRLSAFFLAGPWWNHGTVWRLAGYTANHNEQFSEKTLGPLFSLYAASPTIIKVSVDLPAPTTPHLTTGPILSAYLETASTIPAGMVVVRLAVMAEKITAVDGDLLPGKTVYFSDLAGYGLPDFDGVGATNYGPSVTHAFARQWVTVAGIDTLMLQLGSNDQEYTTQAQFLAAYRRIQALYSADTGDPIGVVNLGVYPQADGFNTTLSADAANNATSITLTAATGLQAGTRIRINDFGWQLQVNGSPSAGTFSLYVTTIVSATAQATTAKTGTIAYNASAANVATALNALSNVNGGASVVGPLNGTYNITFTDHSTMLAPGDNNLTGGTLYVGHDYEDVYPAPAYVEGSTTVALEISLFGTDHNHASGSPVSYYTQDTALSGRARIGPLIAGAVVAHAADAKVLTFDWHSWGGTFNSWDERVIGNQWNPARDYLHPTGQHATDLIWQATFARLEAVAASVVPSTANVVSGITYGFDSELTGVAPQYTTALAASVAGGDNVEVTLGGTAARSFQSLVNGTNVNLTGGPLVSVWRNGTQTALLPTTSHATTGFYAVTEPATVANGFAVGDSCWFRVNGTNSAGAFTVDKPFTVVSGGGSIINGGYGVTFHVTSDGTNALSGVNLQVTQGSITEGKQTSAGGTASYALNLGTANVGASLTGYASTSGAYTIGSGCNGATIDLVLSPIVITPAANAGQVTGSLYTYDGQGALASASIDFQMTGWSGTANGSFSRDVFTLTSNTNGLLVANFEQSASYRGRRNQSGGITGHWATFNTPTNSTSFQLPAILGGMGT